METLIPTLLKYLYTMLIVFILARILYYRYRGQKEILFTYILLSAIISLLCILISRVEISLGFALGIFAIFGIISFRTTQVSPREMTYLFLCAGVAAKNILAPQDIEFYRLLISDASILVLAGGAELFLFRRNISSKTIIYNNLDLIHPNRSKELKEDLAKKFGIMEIQKIKIGDINTAKKFAKIQVDFVDDEGINLYEND